MGIKLNWTLVPGQTLDQIEIYRSVEPIDRENPGTPYILVEGAATTFEDNGVKNKDIFYYRLAGVKGDDRAWGENHIGAYFAETGPGRSTPLRGDWMSGYMDTVPSAKFVTSSTLFEKLPVLRNISGASSINSWWKVCFKGKFLFVATTTMTSSPEWLYNNGLLYGVKGFGTEWPHGTDGGVDQLTVAEIDGLRYSVRPMRITPDDQTEYVPGGSAGLVGSEWAECIARLWKRSVGDDPKVSKPRMLDLSSAPGYFGPGCWGAGKHRARLTGPYTTSSLDWKTQGHWLMVLELIQT